MISTANTLPSLSRRGCCMVVALMAMAVGCRREARNFATGGPDLMPAALDRTEADSKQREREISFEKNAFALSEGKRLYSNFNCVGCHAFGGGDIGPALMDATWLYGATASDVFTSIMDGRPNGMPAFRGRIAETQAYQLTAYVRSLSGQANRNAATSRDDHMKTSPPENSLDRETPRLAPTRSSVFQK